MKKILGKIAIVVSFLTLSLWGEVKVSLSSPVIYEGDNANYIISVDGENIKFPEISDIEGYPIIGTSIAEYTNIINGHRTRTVSKTYSFRPLKTILIPKYTVKVDGKDVETEEIKIKVVEPQASKNGSPFVLQMRLDKNESFVGEPVDLEIIFKQKINERIDKLELREPKLENFWVKKINDNRQSTEGDYIVQTVHYKLFPQRSGDYNIDRISVLIGQVERRRKRYDPFFDPFGQDLTWQKIYSNRLKLKVNPLPNGLELYGKYKISAKVDKTTISVNKPTNLTITVEGEGNIDDIKKFNLEIENVIVYTDEPKITTKLVNNVYNGKFVQKVALIGDRDFTIPPLVLTYFDKDTKNIKRIETEPIKIKVKNGNNRFVAKSGLKDEIEKPAPIITTKTRIVKEDAYLKYVFLLIGLILGFGLSYTANHLKNQKNVRESEILKGIKKAKGNRELYELLLPYANRSKKIAKILDKLDDNIYKNGKHKIEKDNIIEIFEEEKL